MPSQTATGFTMNSATVPINQPWRSWEECCNTTTSLKSTALLTGFLFRKETGKYHCFNRRDFPWNTSIEHYIPVTPYLPYLSIYLPIHRSLKKHIPVCGDIHYTVPIHLLFTIFPLYPQAFPSDLRVSATELGLPLQDLALQRLCGDLGCGTLVISCM